MMKKFISSFLILMSAIYLTGCVALAPDENLLSSSVQHNKPLVKENYVLTTTINEKVEKQATAEGVKDLIDSSIRVALDKANFFTKNSDTNYIITAHIKQASQPAFSFKDFYGKMEIHYKVTDSKGKLLIDKEIYTEAGSDSKSFLGHNRHVRSRIVNTSKNVNQFIELLNEKLKNR